MKENTSLQDIGLTLPSGACGRADLLIALAMANGHAAREIQLARMLGYVAKPSAGNEIIINGKPATISINTNAATLPDSPQSLPLFSPYRLVALETVASKEEWRSRSLDHSEAGLLGQADRVAWCADQPKPQSMPIVPWTRLWPRLRQAVARSRQSLLDIPRLTQQLARGEVVHRLPRKPRLSWPNPLPMVLDFSDRLTPYWDDWHWFRQQLQSRFHRQTRCYRLHGVPQKSLQAIEMNGYPSARFQEWPRLIQGDSLLIVSDLGMIDSARPWPAECWQTKLTEYQRRGVRVIVLAPIAARHMQPSLVNRVELVRLSLDSTLRPERRLPPMQSQSNAQSQPALLPAAEILLTMMSIATRVEPALLRALRTCLPGGARDAGLEGEVWCYPELDTAATACAIAPWAVQRWRDKFAELPEALQQCTLDCLRNWHAYLPQAIHHEETLLWQHLTAVGINQEEAANTEQARSFFNKLINSLEAQNITSSQPPGSRARMVQLADRHVRWVASTLKKREPYIERLSVAVIQAEPERGREGLPAGIDPVAWLNASPDSVLQRMNLLQGPDRVLTLLPVAFPIPTGTTRLATIEIDRATLLWASLQEAGLSPYHPWNWQTPQLDQAPVLPSQLGLFTETSLLPPLHLHTGRHNLRFEPFHPPSWATAWGQDASGLYADLKIEQIAQRFRWIAPGTFLMGSPDSEAERFDDETQHEVTLTRGFWLADSACTQALWQAVMDDDNPSRFQEDSQNPVDSVSWHDVQQFIARLNGLYPGLAARLPTEAEWEYACRAGTTTPFSFGEQITSEQVNYQGEYPYAGGEKGVYREKTVPIKSLPPNPWGLYEMHGNVWEWCHDWYGKYPAQALTDPTGSSESADRVLRGGSWDNFGRSVRSAFRNGYEPDGRSDNAGFRLALGQEREIGQDMQASEDRKHGEGEAADRAAAAEQGSQDSSVSPLDKR